MIYSDPSLSLVLSYPLSNDKAFGLLGAGCDDETELVGLFTFVSVFVASVEVPTDEEDIEDALVVFRLTKFANENFWPNPTGFLNVPIDN